jgi:hypothetical protein
MRVCFHVFRAGERWIYRPPNSFEHSRIVVGAVVTFADGQPIVCCAVTGCRTVFRTAALMRLPSHSCR